MADIEENARRFGKREWSAAVADDHQRLLWRSEPFGFFDHVEAYD
jgi:hypothetical protein